MRAIVVDRWMEPGELVDWARASINIVKPDEDLTEDDYGRIIKWIGYCSLDTLYVDDGLPRLGRIGIGNMLFVTLMVFPTLYIKYEMWQRN